MKGSVWQHPLFPPALHVQRAADGQAAALEDVGVKPGRPLIVAFLPAAGEFLLWHYRLP